MRTPNRRTVSTLLGLAAVFAFCGMRCGGVLVTPSGSTDAPATEAAHTFIDVFTTYGTTCGLTNQNQLYCWGLNLGTFDTSVAANLAVTAPVLISAVPDSLQLFGASQVICGASASGTERWCFGNSANGSMGTGASGTVSYSAASFFGSSFLTDFGGTAAIYSGDQDSMCAIRTSDQAAYCWGDNTYGQVGNGTSGAAVSAPTAVPGGLTFSEIYAGMSHTCAVTLDGSVYCWGRNNYGQLGDASTVDRNLPVQVQGLTGPVASVRTGTSSSCARLVDGTVQCWGYQGNGSLGLGLVPSESTAQVVPGISNAVALATIRHTVLVAMSDGTAKCWGTYGGGLFGDGIVDTGQSTNLSPTVCLTGLPLSTKIVTGDATGGGTACAFTAAGTIYCWGGNAGNQVTGTVSDGVVYAPFGPITAP